MLIIAMFKLCQKQDNLLARDVASYKRPLLSGSVCGCVSVCLSAARLVPYRQRLCQEQITDSCITFQHSLPSLARLVVIHFAVYLSNSKKRNLTKIMWNNGNVVRNNSCNNE